jgi:hypothetical protein
MLQGVHHARLLLGRKIGHLAVQPAQNPSRQGGTFDEFRTPPSAPGGQDDSEDNHRSDKRQKRNIDAKTVKSNLMSMLKLKPRCASKKPRATQTTSADVKSLSQLQESSRETRRVCFTLATRSTRITCP